MIGRPPPAPSRREFVAGALAAAASAAGIAAGIGADSGAVADQPPRAGTGASAGAAAPGAIDIHHHLLPPAYLARHRDEVARVAPGFEAVLDWTPRRSLDEMDAAGIERALLSMSTPGIWFGDAARSRAVARECNEFGAGLAAAHPRRFGWFAAVPLPDADGALAEIAHALDVLGADGIGLMTNYDGRYLGDPTFAPALAELDRRGAVVYVHPHGADCCRNLATGVPMAAMEFPFDTTRTISSLFFAGVFARHPRIRFVFSHGGGALPMLLTRLENFARLQAARGGPPTGDFLAQVARQYYDTASVFHPAGWSALTQAVPESQVLFGTDFPFSPALPGRRALQALVPDPTRRRAIERDNALRLLG